MLPSEFKPLDIGIKNLIRIGPETDGGYVIDRRIIKCTENIITCGLNDDWEFEKHFLKIKPDISIVAYDHTVDNIFWFKRLMKDVFHFFLLKKLRFSKIKKIFKFFDYKIFFSGKNIHHKLKVGNSEKKNKEITINRILKDKKKRFTKN